MQKKTTPHEKRQKKKHCTHLKPGDGCCKLVLSPRLTNTGEERDEKNQFFTRPREKGSMNTEKNERKAIISDNNNNERSSGQNTTNKTEAEEYKTKYKMECTHGQCTANAIDFGQWFNFGSFLRQLYSL